MRCKKYDLAIIAKPTEGFSEAENSFRSIHHKWWKNNVVNRSSCRRNG
jgi:hypothetical protein